MRVTTATLLLAALAVAGTAFAHDHRRPDLAGWFQGLHSNGGSWCCDGPGKDALHLSDADWETKDGKYRVKIPIDQPSFQRALKGAQVDTVWADVPDDAVITEANRHGATLVWPIYGYAGGTVRCFMPGTMT